MWKIIYHPDVVHDLKRLGRAGAVTVLEVIESRLAEGEPDKLGKPLSGNLKGYRRLRTGQSRIIYRANKTKIEVIIISVGMRRNDEVYKTAAIRQELG